MSRAIAFDGLLNSGEIFAERLLGGFNGRDGAQLVHVATDGESYGHHHRHGEMALAYALQLIEEGDIKLTNYGQYLSKFPPTEEAEIVEKSSWSCFHGVERWRSDCGCNGGKAGWNQKWRAPLRDALDWLRDTLAPPVRAACSELLADADAARNDYISVILDRSHASIDAFFARHSIRTLTAEERVRALDLMELERNAMLMYTSCGWFFDDISGIETVQIITYAARAVELAAMLFPETRGVLEKGFTDRLAKAESNDPQWRDGRYIYDEAIRPMIVDLEQVVAHYAISCVFPRAGEVSTDRDRLFCYTIAHVWETTLPYGLGQLRLGRVRICSILTEECEEAAYGLLHFGDQNVSAAVKRVDAEEQEALSALAKEIEDAVDASNLTEVVRLMDDYFGESRFSLTSLFADEQRRIVKSILDPTMQSLETALTDLFSSHASLLHFLGRSGLPRPAALRVAAQFAIHAQLRHAMEADPIDRGGGGAAAGTGARRGCGGGLPDTGLPGRRAHARSHGTAAADPFGSRGRAPCPQPGNRPARPSVFAGPVAGAEYLVRAVSACCRGGKGTPGRFPCSWRGIEYPGGPTRESCAVMHIRRTQRRLETSLPVMGARTVTCDHLIFSRKAVPSRIGNSEVYPKVLCSHCSSITVDLRLENAFVA